MLSKWPLYTVLGISLTLTMGTRSATAQFDFGDILRQGARQLERELQRESGGRREEGRPEEPPQYQKRVLPDETGDKNLPDGYRPDPGWGRPDDSWRNPPARRPQPPRQPQRPPERRQPGNGLPIKISCPDTQQGQCPYALSTGSRSYPFTLKPGYSQKLTAKWAWSIRYNGAGGTKTYRLRGGNDYVFQRDRNGYWQLYKAPPKRVIEPPPLPQ